jgi:hypothetical protein
MQRITIPASTPRAGPVSRHFADLMGLEDRGIRLRALIFRWA